MSVVSNWTRYEYENQITDIRDARTILNLLRTTSATHDDEFSNQAFIARKLKNKINTLKLSVPNSGTQNVPDGPIAYSKKYNWMKATVGKDANSAPVVAILYHLLRHRLQAGAEGIWSVSVGFLPNLVTGPGSADPTNTRDPYYILAAEICARIKVDLNGSSDGSVQAMKPASGGYCVMYDNIDPNEAPGDLPGAIVDDRRQTRIGELGWVFQNASPQLSLKIKSRSKVAVPNDNDGTPIGGWNPVNGKIAVTVLQTT